ncbi:DUF4349 domain-containing protein [Streptacidiphilus sp. PAMC 29251]
MGGPTGRAGVRKRTGAAVAAVVLAGGLALGGCGAAGEKSAGSSAARGPAAPQAADGAAKGVAGAGQGAASADSGSNPGNSSDASGKGGSKVVPTAPAGRSIIYTGEIQLRTRGASGADGVDAAVARAEQLVSSAGGFIDSEVTGSDGELPQPYADQGTVAGGTADTGSDSVQSQAQPLPQPADAEGESAQLVLRIPVGSYDAVYQQLLKLGTVLAHQRQAQDVTQQVVDITSRVKTQQASVARVRDLMNRANSIADVTALEADLTQREADLESLESQLSSLQSQTSMSTVTVQLYSKASPAPVVKAKHGGVSVFGALKGGWHALYATVRAVLIALAAALPFLLPLAALAWLARLLLRRRTVPTSRPAHEEPDLDD